MDKRLHTACDLPFWRRCDFLIVHTIIPCRHAIQRLPDNLQTLFYLQHAHHISIIYVAFRPNRNIKIKLVISRVREALTDIPDEAATPQRWTASTVCDGIFSGQDTYILRAFKPDWVVRQQIVIFL